MDCYADCLAANLLPIEYELEWKNQADLEWKNQADLEWPVKVDYMEMAFSLGEHYVKSIVKLNKHKSMDEAVGVAESVVQMDCDALDVSVVYHSNMEEMRNGTRRIINQGGQYSGKTVNILIALMSMAMEEPGEVTTVTSMSMPHLKGGALRDFEMYVYPHFKGAISKYNKTDHLFTLRNGHLIEFKVFESEMSARGHKRKRLYINEANRFKWMTWFQLDSRSEQSIIDYNPSIRFWAHEKIIGTEGSSLLISDHRHNPFLTEAKHREIEGIKDPELWKVYARGITGNVTGVIFPNWDMIDEEKMPQDEDWIYSVDFGYTNDPTAIMKQVLIANTLYVKELAYETGLPPKSIRQILVADGYKDTSPLYCEHDPDMIKALRKLGINAFPARKGQGSINAGIELLKTYDVKYSNMSRNLNRERGMYVWMTDKDEKSTNVPIDSNNHCFDAIRYGVYTRYLRT